MDITTIKISKKTKAKLDKEKRVGETYDQAIEQLLVRSSLKTFRKDLAKAYKENAAEARRVNKEWESANTW